MLSADSTRTTARSRHRPGWPDIVDPPLGTNGGTNGDTNGSTNGGAPDTPHPPHATAAGVVGKVTSDWDDMLDAVTARLHGILESTRPGAEQPESLAQAGRTHALALECAAALGLLRAAMACERTDQRRLERELGDARAALAQAQLDFEDSHAGELHARQLALHDELTALPNRRHCRERLDEALALAAARRTTAALLYLDLDGFKAINDRHGHETGDEVLRIAAARLSRAVRAGDVVCRLGGDEFVCLPAGPLGDPQLAHLASKLYDAVSAPLTVNTLQLQVRPSIGVAIFPTHADNTEALLHAADAAMYRAKQQRIGFAFAENRVEIGLPLR